MKRGFAALLLVVAGALVALVRFLDPGALPPESRPPVEQRLPPEAPPRQSASPRSTPSGELASLGDAERDAQVRRVVAAMDATGRPPAAVAQGGRRHGPKGVFDNLQGRLPRQARGYYVESDVWPRGPGSRGRERLVFGRAGEVYYTRDHYETFVQLRGAR